MMPRFIGSGKNVPPIKKYVIIYFSEKGMSTHQALEFFSHFENRKWENYRNKPLFNWKTAAWEWILKNWNSAN